MKIKSIKRETNIIKESPWNIVEFSAAKDKKIKGDWKSVWNSKNNIIITNAQWVLLHGDKTPYIDMIVADEVHGVKSSTEISKLIKGVDIPYKYGCTGTMPKAIKDQWNIIGIFGPILDELEIETLQNKNVLADVNIKPIRFCHLKKENFKKLYDADGNPIDIMEAAQSEYMNESQFLGEYLPTNEKICELAAGLVNKRPDWNVLVLFDYIAQGKQLFETSKHQNKFYIDGSIKVEERQKIVSTMDNTGGNILFGNSKCIGTGLTIKKVNVIILCIIGSSSTKTIQAIGRGMQKKEDKSTVYVFDIFHNYKYSQKHYKERTENYLKYYKLKEGKDYKIKDIEI